MYVVKHITVNNTTHYGEFAEAEEAFRYAEKMYKHFATREVRVYEEDTNGNLMRHVIWEKQ